jgi:cyclopropane-fatty-acyl-phospholipid synthase
VRDPAIDAAVAFVDAILPPPRPFDIRLWDGTALPGESGAGLTLVIARRASLRRAFRLPLELSLGEAFLRGDLELEGDISAAPGVVEACQAALGRLGDLLVLARRWWALPGDEPQVLQTAYPPADRSDAKTRRAGDRAAIQYHYDVGNDFYELFLDRRMVYSCAYFPTGTETLDEAQERKLEHICRKLRLSPGERLLDIGCGWGGLLIYAAERYGVKGVGVTLAENQRALAQARIRDAALADRVTVRLQDYRDISDGPFDKIVSVGMFEHVGRSRYVDYFATAFRLLRPRGLFLNHGISERVDQPARTTRGALGRALSHFLVGRYAFRKRYVFPVGDVAPVSVANLAAERAGFEVHDVENLRPHYALTLRHWVRRLEAEKDKAVRIGGETRYRLWRLYLGVAAYQFASGRQTVNQTLLGKTNRGDAGLPLSRADLYAHPGGGR